MVALTGPSSSTWAPVGAIKRPSEVPPEVESSVSIPLTLRIAARVASTRSPAGVRKGSPESFQSSV